MKVYLYDTVHGVYLGEDYIPAKGEVNDEGLTTVAPPPYRRGEVPLFDTASLQWRVVSAALLQAGIKERG